MMVRSLPLRAFGLMLGLASLAQAQTEPAASLKELTKPITVKLKAMPIRDAFKALGDAGGVSLDTYTSIKDLKVTVLVKDTPLSMVMARIADTFHGSWEMVGPTYRLAVSPDWATATRRYIAAEDKERRKEAEATVGALAKSASIPYREVIAELASNKSSQLSPQDREALERVSSPDQYLLGYMFHQMSDSDMDAFWGGKVFHYAEAIPAGQATSTGEMPDQTGAPTNRRRRRPQPMPQGQTIRVTAYYDSLTGHLFMGAGARNPVGTENGKLIDRPYPTGNLAQTPFGKDVLAWNRIETDNQGLNTVVGASPLTGAYFGNKTSMADVLEYLHDQTGVPIVADAFRVPVAAPKKGGAIAEWLGGLQQGANCFVRTQDGFVMIRHGGFWRLRQFEAPEDVYAALEKTQTPGLDGYSAFATNLTDAQALPFRIPQASLLKVNPEPLRKAMAALRFYGSLDSGERAAALAGTPVGFTRLGSSSQALFMNALDNPTAGSLVGPGVPNAEAPAVASQLGFLLTGGAVSRTAQPDGIVAGGVQMLFGLNPRAAVVYTVPVSG